MSTERNPTETASMSTPLAVRAIRNLGEPLQFTNVEAIAGVSVAAARPGQQIKVATRLAMTSDEPLFHRLVENFSGIVTHMAQQSGRVAPLDRANLALLVIKADSTAQLWLDTAAVQITCRLKRAVKAGSMIFHSDVADITGMSFPDIRLQPTDKVFCIFREDWRFGMAFDFNPNGKLDVEDFSATLGRLCRQMRYSHVYAIVADEKLFGRLVGAGWFPFAEIVSGEFRDLLDHLESGFELTEMEETLVAKFGDARLDNVFERWIAKPHFKSKADILKAAIDAFRRKEPIAVIKILLTEIEGVLSDAYATVHGGKRAKIRELLAFAVQSGERQSGAPDTLLFPVAFAQYLDAHTFGTFDPVARTGTAGSRHAVGHGAAPQDTYTMARALQAILSLDQLAFYT